MGDVENQGAKPRDHEHRRHHYYRTAHRDWRFWVVVGLMVALVLVYVFTDSLSLRPRGPAGPPVPAVGGP